MTVLRDYNAAVDLAGKEPEPAAQDNSALSVFFNPKSVAVVGASSDPKKPGNTALRHMISMGYKGKLYPVNPREKGILGLPCYKSVSDIPEPVELCILMVAAELTVPVAKEMAERKKRFNDIKGAICMSAGFGEIDSPEAKQRQKDLIDILRSASIRLIGPNCVGVMDTVSGFNTNFDIGSYPRGGISVLTQSGAFGNSFLFASGTSGRVGLNKYVSMGNMADVQMAELLAFLKDDVTTRVIGIYLEGLSDPRGFFQAASEAAAVKPVVVLKSGRSELGSTAALSHTGAIAGAEAIYEGAFRQFGLMRVRSVAEFYDTLRAFSMQPVPKGGRVAVLTHMGGPGTMCIDEISELPGITMASFTNETHAALKAILSPAANVGHPPGYIDLTAAHFERLHHQVLQILFKDPNVNSVIQILAPSAFLDQPLLAKEVSAAFQAQGSSPKPLLNVITFGDFADNLRRGLENASLPTFDYPDTVARVAANLSNYGTIRAAALADGKTPLAATKGPAAQLIAATAKEGRVSLLEPEAYAVCKQYDIPVPPFKMVDSLAGRLSGRPRDRLPGRDQSGVGADPAQIRYRRRHARHRFRQRAGKILCAARRQCPQGGARNQQAERAGAENDAGGDRTGAGRDPRQTVRPGGDVRPRRHLCRSAQARRFSPGAVRHRAGARAHPRHAAAEDHRRRARPQETRCRRHRRHAGLAWPVAGGAPADRRSGPQSLPGARRRLPGGGRAHHPG